jgi:hypothetical protein
MTLKRTNLTVGTRSKHALQSIILSCRNEAFWNLRGRAADSIDGLFDSYHLISSLVPVCLACCLCGNGGQNIFSRETLIQQTKAFRLLGQLLASQ